MGDRAVRRSARLKAARRLEESRLVEECHLEESRLAEERRLEEERRHEEFVRHRQAEIRDKQVQRYFLLYMCLGSEQVRSAIAEPRGWRLPIPDGDLLPLIREMEAELDQRR
jgi:hypothetical protein